MSYDELLHLFGQFGLVILLGFLIGLEREMRGGARVTLGIRDFVLFALLGAVSGFLAAAFDNSWLVVAGLVGLLTFVASSYWAERGHGPGITSELAGVLTFFLGVLIMRDAQELAIALAIVILGVLFPKQAIKAFGARVKSAEMQAVLLFLAITFIVLPVLPNQTLDHYATVPVGIVQAISPADGAIELKLADDTSVERGELLEVFSAGWKYLGTLRVTEVREPAAVGVFSDGPAEALEPGQMVRSRLGIAALTLTLEALNPYRIWLIVVLVSFVSFLGYALIKVVGSRAGIGLTGLIGGLVSSTVTTISFAKRSRELPQAIPLFAAAVILAGSIMFPRLIVEIGVFNPQLMRAIALPLGVMGLMGILLAWWYFRRPVTHAEAPAISFDNPFSLKSAVSFALLFAVILVATRLATAYLGEAWLPVVAVVSGLTDADAIAFSISNLQRAGLVTTDWAAFNLVLGAIANTFIKLLLVFLLGNRALFRDLAIAFVLIGTSGLVVTFLYYDF